MRRVLAASALIACALISTSDARAQRPPSQSHSIYMTAVEFTGSTTTDKLAPPPVDPTKLSHGYVYKRPGQANPAARDRWEVSTYQFSPSFMTVRQDDSVMLTVFIVNGDHHEVELTDPDGEQIIANTAWDRGHEYTAFFQTRKVGTYRLECAVHRPSMTAEIMVLPR
jgi:plastocyanin